MKAILVGPLYSGIEVRENPFEKGTGDHCVIAVDGGLDALRSFGVTPDFAVGDWDSLKKKSLLKNVLNLTLPTTKDRSDLYYAMVAAVEMGATELTCFGVAGGRPDHHLSMLMDLAEIALESLRPVQSVEVQGAGARYRFLAPHMGKLQMSLRKGQLVSVFGMHGGAHGVSLKGFRYSIQDTALMPSSLGLSNIVTASKCEVEIKKGCVAIIIPKAPKNSEKGKG
jgi:thiamine pyrophosphokinase